MSKPPRRAGRKRKSKITLAGNVTIITMENPYFQRSHAESQANPREIPVRFDMRENYAGYLFARKHINKAQREAANRVRHAYERMGGAGAQAIDYARERVDGGQIAKTITDAHLEAAGILRSAYDCLGPEGYHLVVSFCGEGQWPKEFSRHNDLPKPGVLFRDCLSTLAERWGYQTRTNAIRSWRIE